MRSTSRKFTTANQLAAVGKDKKGEPIIYEGQINDHSMIDEIVFQIEQYSPDDKAKPIVLLQSKQPMKLNSFLKFQNQSTVVTLYCLNRFTGTIDSTGKGDAKVNFKIQFTESASKDSQAIIDQMKLEMEHLSTQYENVRRQINTLSQRWGFIHLSIEEAE